MEIFFDITIYIFLLYRVVGEKICSDTKKISMILGKIFLPVIGLLDTIHVRQEIFFSAFEKIFR